MAILEAARQIAVIALCVSTPSAEATRPFVESTPIEKPAFPSDAVLPENTIFTIKNGRGGEAPQPGSPISFIPEIESSQRDRVQWNGRATFNSDAQINSRKPSTFGRSLQH